MSTNAPFFSIIIPTYNRRELVSRAVQSVYTQYFTDFELIVVDDGSTDGTSETLRSNLADPRLILISGPNQGRSAARNKGIDRASGKYICFLDSDDAFFSDHLESLHRYLETNNYPAGLLRTFAIFKYEDGTEESQPIELIKPGERPIDYILARSTLFPSEVCIHREAIGMLRFNTGYSLGEDTDFFVRVLARVSLHSIGKATVAFYFHSGNSQMGEMVRIHKAYLNVFEQLQDVPELEGKFDLSLIKELIKRRKDWLAAALKESGDYSGFILQKIKNIF